MFLHGEQVGQGLRRVGFIGQSIPNGHTGIASKFLYPRLRKSAILDAIIHAAQDASRILHGFLAADVRAVWTDVGNVGALIERGNLECAAGARRVFFEDEGDVFAFQSPGLSFRVFRRFQFG